MAKKPKSGSPPWMATFADLSTLMLTFFVLMLSMANIDIQSFREMLGSVKEAFGVQIEQPGLYQAAIEEEIDPSAKDIGLGEWQRKPEEAYVGDLEVEIPAESQDQEQTEQEKALAAAKAQETAERKEAVKEIQAAISQTQMGELADVRSGARGIRIRVKGALLFDPGASDIRPQAKPFLDNLVQVLQRYPYHLLVEGHTDSQPIATAQFPSNWELSSHRASAVLRYLITWGIDPNRMTAVGLADNFPIADNNTAEGRAENRRVEFVLTKQSFRPEID